MGVWSAFGSNVTAQAQAKGNHHPNCRRSRRTFSANGKSFPLALRAWVSGRGTTRKSFLCDERNEGDGGRCERGRGSLFSEVNAAQTAASD